MTKTETVALLAALAQFQHVEADAVAVEMWAAALDDDLPAEWALAFVAVWHGQPASKGRRIYPGDLNAAWRTHLRQSLPATERHCGRLRCPCPHITPCDRGWLDTTPDTAVPCPTCRPERATARPITTKAAS